MITFGINISWVHDGAVYEGCLENPKHSPDYYKFRLAVYRHPIMVCIEHMRHRDTPPAVLDLDLIFSHIMDLDTGLQQRAPNAIRDPADPLHESALSVQRLVDDQFPNNASEGLYFWISWYTHNHDLDEFFERFPILEDDG